MQFIPLLYVSAMEELIAYLNQLSHLLEGLGFELMTLGDFRCIRTGLLVSPIQPLT